MVPPSISQVPALRDDSPALPSPEDVIGAGGGGEGAKGLGKGELVAGGRSPAALCHGGAAELTIVSKKTQRKKAPPSPDASKKFHESWEFFGTHRNGLRIVGYAYTAGAVAAMCGIGGGMLLGPVMLEMGLRPEVCVATTATTLFMLSTTAASVFIANGVAPLHYSLFFAGLTFVGAITGKWTIAVMVKKYNRNSIIALLLAGITIISTIMLLFNVADVVENVSLAAKGEKEAWERLWFKDACPTGQ